MTKTFQSAINVMLDGLLICIDRPAPHYQSKRFWSRKGFYALNLQALVDANRKFLDLSIRSPGSTNDNLAWSLSNTAHWIEEGGLTTLTKDLAFELFNLPNGFFVVGDNAYTCSDFLIVPYPGSDLSISQDSYNFYESQIRINVECTFGMFLNRWGIFWKPLRVKLEKVPKLVLACAHLHNFIIEHSSYKVPTALVLQDSAPGTKNPPVSARAHVAPPDVKQFLNEIAGVENRTTKTTGTNTRQFICDSLQKKGLLRPSHSSFRRTKESKDERDAAE